jgi:hypothetical protein
VHGVVYALGALCSRCSVRARDAAFTLLQSTLPEFDTPYRSSRHSTGVPYLSSLPEFPTRVPYLSSLPEFPTRVPYLSSLPEFPTRVRDFLPEYEVRSILPEYEVSYLSTKYEVSYRSTKYPT